MARLVLAAVLGGIVAFIWGAVVHMVLPIGKISMELAPAETQAQMLDTLHAGLPKAGVYLLPMLDEADWEDEAKSRAFGERAAQQPYAFVVYKPKGTDMMAEFPRLLGKQLLFDLLAAGLATVLVARSVGSVLARALTVSGYGVFGWLCINVPYWNWYGFPLDFTLGALFEHAVGWLLVGLAIAWVLRNRPASA
jgi:hypothetical protein